jgi:hypothetical protein
MQFEWDAARAAANLKKHRVSFDEATTVFRDPLAVIFNHEDHSATERRENIVGHSLLKSPGFGLLHRAWQGPRSHFQFAGSNQERAERL